VSKAAVINKGSNFSGALKDKGRNSCRLEYILSVYLMITLFITAA
jgi:hypothetical protein